MHEAFEDDVKGGLRKETIRYGMDLLPVCKKG